MHDDSDIIDIIKIYFYGAYATIHSSINVLIAEFVPFINSKSNQIKY